MFLQNLFRYVRALWSAVGSEAPHRFGCFIVNGASPAAPVHPKRCRRYALSPHSIALFTIILSLISLHAADTTPEDLLRQGLFEEEANRNFDKAAEQYRAVIAAHDKQRALAATATFRLGEIARKKNDKETAATAFHTVAERFPEQTDLARMSRENLAALGIALPNSPRGYVATDVSPKDAEDEEIQNLRKLASSSPDLIDGAAENGWRPLHLAAMNGSMKVMAYLMVRKVDVDSRTTREQFTALHLAAIHGRLDAVKALLDAKAKIDETVEFRPEVDKGLPPRDESVGKLFGEWTALDLAVLYDRREVARALIKAGAKIKRDGPEMEQLGRVTPLSLALYLHRDPTALELIAASSPYENSDDKWFSWDLSSAIRYNPKMVDPLIQAGKKSGRSDPTGGIIPLITAAWKEDVAIMKQLIDAGADLKAVNKDQRTVLFSASTPEMVEFLLSEGAELNAKDKEGRTPIDSVIGENVVSSERNAAILETLLKHGAVVDPKSVMSRASDKMLTAVLDDVVYPKAWRADGVLLSLNPSSYDTVSKNGTIERTYHREMKILETRSAEVESPQSLMAYAQTDEIKKMMFGNSFVLSIVRRDAKGEFNEIQIGKWHPGSKEWGNLNQEVKADLLKWGDIIEIRPQTYVDYRRKK